MLFITNITTTHLIMRRNNLAAIATENNEFLIANKIKIPRTIEVKWDLKRANPCPPIQGKTRVIFEMLKTDECALKYLNGNISSNVFIMNFASRHSHGGGYLRGARAQEEDLCRVIPQLYPSLTSIKYPYEQGSVLLTPNMAIMKDNEKYKWIEETEHRKVGVVSCAAQHMNHEEFDPDLVRCILINMYTSVKLYYPETDTLILGAWDNPSNGSRGAYRNDPATMAKIMNEINLQYGGLYKYVIFSVPEGVEENVKEFRSRITYI